jgi:hypothetical protein
VYTDRLGVFLPILKAFAQLAVENGTIGMSLLDFAHRRLIFEQQDIKGGQVSWVNLKDAMAESSLTAVDLHDLEREERFAGFFRSEMARRLDENDGAVRVVIVISGPMDLGSDTPIEIAPPAKGNFAVFYLRCDFLQGSAIVREGQGFAAPVEPSEEEMEKSGDQIGKSLRELKPRVFAVHSAQGVREALAAILSDISRM